jgi:hypothetical protein
LQSFAFCRHRAIVTLLYSTKLMKTYVFDKGLALNVGVMIKKTVFNVL